MFKDFQCFSVRCAHGFGLGALDENAQQLNTWVDMCLQVTERKSDSLSEHSSIYDSVYICIHLLECEFLHFKCSTCRHIL